MYGKKFKILTDHKPLIGLFCQNKVIPHMASSGMQRWCLSLSAYDYVLEFRVGILNRNADGLSRQPLGDFPEIEPIPEDVCSII